MPVAIRKRSWEEHVTHASGLQYSFDDLDLVCCHGVDSEGPWMGAGASKQGRRTRCASMPEGCHQLPTEDLARILEVTASGVNDYTESVDISQRASESEYFRTSNTGNPGEPHWNSNRGISFASISCAIDSSSPSEKTINDEGEVGTESSQSHDICNDDNVFKSPHISREEQQCISISSNNRPSLSESAGEQPGKLPNHQETKESHTESYSRPPEISEATLNQFSTAELEPQTDLLDVEEGETSTTSHSDARVALLAGVLSSSVNMMESGDIMSQADKTVEPVVEEVCDKGVTDSWIADSADRLDGLNVPKTLNENTGLKHHSRDIQGGEQDHHDCPGILEQTYGCEISCQKLLEQHNVEMTAMNGPQGEESAQAESSEKAADIRYGPNTSSDTCFKDQCCSVTVEKLNTGYSEGNPIQSNITQCVDQYLAMASPIGQPTENPDESVVSKEFACCEDQTLAQQLENSYSKLNPIPEVSHVEPDDTPILDPQRNSDFTQKPDIQRSHMDDKHAATEKHTKNLPASSAEVCDELSPEGLHGNQKASGCYLSESPASEVADGQREHHTPAAAVSRMEETQTVIYNDMRLASPVLDGRNEPEDQKEDNVVRVRMRKREHARLDSMVLLLMKLDQLDQEIENALSTTSPMDSTATLHRRQLLEFDSGSVLAASQNPPNPHIPAASTSVPTQALGAKPKSGSSVAAEDVPSQRGGWRLPTPGHLPLNVAVGNNISVTLSTERSHRRDILRIT